MRRILDRLDASAVMALLLALSTALALAWAAPASAQPVSTTGTITSQTGTVSLPTQGNTSVRIAVAGTFSAWYMVDVTSDPACGVASPWTAGHLVDAFYFEAMSTTNQTGVFEIAPMGGVQCVRVRIYGTQPVYGYASGTIEVQMTATAAIAPIIVSSGGHLSAKIVPVQSNNNLNSQVVGGWNADTVWSQAGVISQNICLSGITIVAEGASATTQVRLYSGPVGAANERIDFGTHTIAQSGPAWERWFGRPICAGSGDALNIYATAGGPNSRLKISVVAD